MSLGTISRAARRILLLAWCSLVLFKCDAIFDIAPPEIKIIEPSVGVIYFGTLPVELQVTDNSKVEKVELFLEGKSVHEFTNGPYVADLDISGDTTSTKALKIVAHDRVGNWSEARQDINLGPPFSSSVKLLAPDAQPEDLFGRAVALSGDYALVGAFLEGTTGAAYVFQRTGANSWDSGTKLTAPDAQPDDWFGRSVALSGDYAIVGAFYKDAGETDAGAAYVFRRTGANSWDGGIKLTAPDAQAGDLFGRSVALDGDYALVGADGKDVGGSNAGAAYVFQRTGTNSWDSGFKITAPDAEAGARFGYSGALDGDYALVGAFGDDAGGSDAGAAYVFQRTGTNSWDGGFKITAPDAQADNWFGFSVALSDRYTLVGAPEKDASAGAAYIFNRSGPNSWYFVTKIVAPDAQESDWFGFSVAISLSSGYALVGAQRENTMGDEAGAAYLFHPAVFPSWPVTAKLTAPDAQAGDRFGVSVAISGDHALVGAWADDTRGFDTGAAYVFR